MIKFEKVSFNQFKNDFIKTYNITNLTEETEERISNIYDNIKLPKRATSGSAGYDFYCPYNIIFPKNEPVLVPTGIRVKMSPEWVLLIFPRSGLGFKKRLRLNNSTGVIDSDYYMSDNEGHIMVKLCCESYDWADSVKINEGEGFVQGVFVQYGMTDNDKPISTTRNGGFGSTTKKEIHAKWNINCDGYYPTCSNCGEEPKSREMEETCPNCGAIMDMKIKKVEKSDG